MKNNESNHINIVLKPKFIFWLTTHAVFLVGIVVIILLSNSYKQYEIVRYAGAILSLVIFTVLFYKYIDMLLCTRWIVTGEQIIIKKGVFSKTVNYIELYRVYDYQERKTFIQALFNNTTLYIHSGDKSHPILCMYGLKEDESLIVSIRERVEKQRKIKEIYEFTNR
jgi:uncharacterized membrane protein YdbT with pleckstrin-like domain